MMCFKWLASTLGVLAVAMFVTADAAPAHDNYSGLLPIKDADVVVNTVGGQAVPALAYLKPGGAIVSIAGARPTAQQCSSAKVSCPSEQGPRVPADAVLLGQLNRLVAAGKFSVHVQKVFLWPQAAEAQAFHQAGHAEGKAVIVLIPK